MRPIHIVEGNMFYSESTHLNVNLIQKPLSLKPTRRMFDQLLEHCGPGKSTHKTNHHSYFTSGTVTPLVSIIFFFNSSLDRFGWKNMFEHFSGIKQGAGILHSWFYWCTSQSCGKNFNITFILQIRKLKLSWFNWLCANQYPGYNSWETLFLQIAVNEILCHGTGFIHLHIPVRKNEIVQVWKVPSFFLSPSLTHLSISPTTHFFKPTLL